MSTLESIMQDLRARGKENPRIVYSRQGIPIGTRFGVSHADLKAIAKTIKRQQALAYELYATGVTDAMYLAGIVANGAPMTRKQLQSWAEGAVGIPMISEHTVPWVTLDNAEARPLANAWIGSKNESIAASGWCSWSGLVATKPDDALDLGEIEALLGRVVKGIDAARGRARYTMNGFVISVGCYVEPLLAKAKAAAREIGEVAVDMGETACKVPLATAYIAKVEAMGRVGQKRKTIRC